MNTIHQPSEQLLRAWHFICKQGNFITPDQIANVAQIGHDAASDCLREWFEHGVLERTPRYPKYVYSCAENWHKTAIAQKFNKLIAFDS
jgi:hypothetical protein